MYTLLDEAQILYSCRQELTCVQDEHSLNMLRSRLFGRSGQLQYATQMLKQLTIADEKKALGLRINQLKEALESLITQKADELEQQRLAQELASSALNITIPGRSKKVGTVHPISKALLEIAEIFGTFGFKIVSGPDIEDEKHNFDDLNIPHGHPARQMHDTFYLASDKLLRTHTSTVQLRQMPKHQPPFRLLAAGRVYRKDYDATHTPMFHQVEGIVVSIDTNMSNLKFLMYEFVRLFFEGKAEVRFRPSHFPFTEPSAEMDIRMNNSDWLEILGCGMIHPQVMKNVGIGGDCQGFAFGMGIERCAMLKYGITDLRNFFNSNTSWLKHHSFSPFDIFGI